MTRRAWSWLAAATLLASALHAAIWFTATVRLEAAADARLRGLGEQGWKVGTGTPLHSGWPFQAVVTVPEVRVVHAASTLVLQTAAVRLTLSPRTPSRVTVALDGPVVAAIDGEAAVPITFSRAEGRFTIVGPGDAEIVLREVRGVFPEGPVALGRFDMHAIYNAAAEASQDALAVEVTAGEIELAGLLPLPATGLGTRIALAELNFTLSGPIWLGLGNQRAVAAAWRDGGGRLSIARLAAQWGRLDLDLQATIGLDARLQPEGRGTLGAGGVSELLDRMVGEGLVPPSSARAIKAVISMMPKTPDGQVSVPAVLQNGTVTVARFPMARMPLVQWQ